MADIMFYEDSVAFDRDDPDFAGKDSNLDCDLDHISKYGLTGKSSVLGHSFSSDCIHSTMSCGIVANSRSFCYSPSSNWLTKSESIESFDTRMDSMLSRVDHEYHGHVHENSMTLEDIRSQFNSCYSCGVSWSDNHVSLDCSECGGYSLCRPCPLCDGKCKTEWQRDVSMSHSVGKAHWEGECQLSVEDRPAIPSFLAEDILIQGLEDLSTSS